MRKILITYINNKSFETESSKHVMFEMAKKTLQGEGLRMIESHDFNTGSMATFDDGSIITLLPVNLLDKYMTQTHIFIHKSAEDTDEGLNLIKNSIFPLLMDKKGNQEFDFTGRRLSTFKLVDGKMEIK